MEKQDRYTGSPLSVASRTPSGSPWPSELSLTESFEDWESANDSELLALGAELRLQPGTPVRETHTPPADARRQPMPWSMRGTTYDRPLPGVRGAHDSAQVIREGYLERFPLKSPVMPVLEGDDRAALPPPGLSRRARGASGDAGDAPVVLRPAGEWHPGLGAESDAASAEGAREKTYRFFAVPASPPGAESEARVRETLRLSPWPAWEPLSDDEHNELRMFGASAYTGSASLGQSAGALSSETEEVPTGSFAVPSSSAQVSETRSPVDSCSTCALSGGYPSDPQALRNYVLNATFNGEHYERAADAHPEARTHYTSVAARAEAEAAGHVMPLYDSLAVRVRDTAASGRMTTPSESGAATSDSEAGSVTQVTWATLPHGATVRIVRRASLGDTRPSEPSHLRAEVAPSPVSSTASSQNVAAAAQPHRAVAASPAWSDGWSFGESTSEYGGASPHLGRDEQMIAAPKAVRGQASSAPHRAAAAGLSLRTGPPAGAQGRHADVSQAASPSSHRIERTPTPGVALSAAVVSDGWSLDLGSAEFASSTGVISDGWSLDLGSMEASSLNDVRSSASRSEPSLSSRSVEGMRRQLSRLALSRASSSATSFPTIHTPVGSGFGSSVCSDELPVPANARVRQVPAFYEDWALSNSERRAEHRRPLARDLSPGSARSSHPSLGWPSGSSATQGSQADHVAPTPPPSESSYGAAMATLWAPQQPATQSVMDGMWSWRTSGLPATQSEAETIGWSDLGSTSDLSSNGMYAAPSVASTFDSVVSSDSTQPRERRARAAADLARRQRYASSAHAAQVGARIPPLRSDGAWRDTNGAADAINVSAGPQNAPRNGRMWVQNARELTPSPGMPHTKGLGTEDVHYEEGARIARRRGSLPGARRWDASMPRASPVPNKWRFFEPSLFAAPQTAHEAARDADSKWQHFDPTLFAPNSAARTRKAAREAWSTETQGTGRATERPQKFHYTTADEKWQFFEPSLFYETDLNALTKESDAKWAAFDPTLFYETDIKALSKEADAKWDAFTPSLFHETDLAALSKDADAKWAAFDPFMFDGWSVIAANLPKPAPPMTKAEKKAARHAARSASHVIPPYRASPRTLKPARSMHMKTFARPAPVSQRPTARVAHPVTHRLTPQMVAAGLAPVPAVRITPGARRALRKAGRRAGLVPSRTEAASPMSDVSANHRPATPESTAAAVFTPSFAEVASLPQTPQVYGVSDLSAGGGQYEPYPARMAVSQPSGGARKGPSGAVHAAPGPAGTKYVAAGPSGITRAGPAGVTRAGPAGVARAGPAGVTRSEPAGVTRAGPAGVARAGPAKVARSGQPRVTGAGYTLATPGPSDMAPPTPEMIHSGTLPRNRRTFADIVFSDTEDAAQSDDGAASGSEDEWNTPQTRRRPVLQSENASMRPARAARRPVFLPTVLSTESLQQDTGEWMIVGNGDTAAMMRTAPSRREALNMQLVVVPSRALVHVGPAQDAHGRVAGAQATPRRATSVRKARTYSAPGVRARGIGRKRGRAPDLGALRRLIQQRLRARLAAEDALETHMRQRMFSPEMHPELYADRHPFEVPAGISTLPMPGAMPLSTPPTRALGTGLGMDPRDEEWRWRPSTRRAITDGRPSVRGAPVRSGFAADRDDIRRAAGRAQRPVVAAFGSAASPQTAPSWTQRPGTRAGAHFGASGVPRNVGTRVPLDLATQQRLGLAEGPLATLRVGVRVPGGRAPLGNDTWNADQWRRNPDAPGDAPGALGEETHAAGPSARARARRDARLARKIAGRAGARMPSVGRAARMLAKSAAAHKAAVYERPGKFHYHTADEKWQFFEPSLFYETDLKALTKESDAKWAAFDPTLFYETDLKALSKEADAKWAAFDPTLFHESALAALADAADAKWAAFDPYLFSETSEARAPLMASSLHAGVTFGAGVAPRGGRMYMAPAMPSHVASTPRMASEAVPRSPGGKWNEDAADDAAGARGGHGAGAQTRAQRGARDWTLADAELYAPGAQPAHTYVASSPSVLAPSERVSETGSVMDMPIPANMERLSAAVSALGVDTPTGSAALELLMRFANHDGECTVNAVDHIARLAVALARAPDHATALSEQRMCRAVVFWDHRRYYAPETRQGALSAYQLECLLMRRDPALAAHLGALGVPTEAYADAWYTDMFAANTRPDVHAAIAATLADAGPAVLHRAALTFMAAHRPELLAASDHTSVLAILRGPLDATAAVDEWSVEDWLAAFAAVDLGDPLELMAMGEEFIAWEMHKTVDMALEDAAALEAEHRALLKDMLVVLQRTHRVMKAHEDAEMALTLGAIERETLRDEIRTRDRQIHLMQHAKRTAAREHAEEERRLAALLNAENAADGHRH